MASRARSRGRRNTGLSDTEDITRSMSSLSFGSQAEAPQAGRGPESRQGQKSPTSSPRTKIGRDIHLISNHFELRWVGTDKDADGKETFSVYQYHVYFQSEDLPLHSRKKILFFSLDKSLGPFIYDGGAELFSTVRYPEDEVIFHSASEGPLQCAVKLVYTKTVPLDHPIYMQIYNLVVRKCLFGMGLDEIGRNFFDTAAVIEYPNLKVELWPGYATSVKQTESGLLLCVDITHKVLREESLQAFIQHVMQLNRNAASSSLEEIVNENIKGLTIMTPYNKKTYRVDNIVMDLNPTSTFTLKNGEEISFVEYFKTRYDANIMDLTQPLVAVSLAQKSGARDVTRILVPEMCVMIGLTEGMRSNMSLMRTLSKHLHMEPKERVELLHQFIAKLSGTPKCRETLNSWGFAFEMKLMKCSIGRVLPPETIVFGKSKTVRVDNNNDFTRALRNMELLSCVPMERWIVVSPARDLDNTKSFVKTMHKVATPLGFQIRKPISYESIQDIRVLNYIRSIETIITQQPKDSIQIILCVLPNNKSELYFAIKKRLSQDLGILSQCLLAKNLTSKGAMSIATKLVIQMSAKLGGEPWTVEIPLQLREKCMAVGFDFYQKSQTATALKTGALVCSINKDHSRYFGITFNYRSGDTLEPQLKQAIHECLKQFKRHNSTAPNYVIFYRANIEEGIISSGVADQESQNIQESLSDWFEDEGVEHNGFVYIAVTKQHNTRVLTHKGGCSEDLPVQAAQMVNPPPGTILDKDIVAADGRYKEFFLAPTNARQGTVRPIYYRVILDSNGFSEDVIQAYTYKMCHLYYNWSGAVNVPSTCQYAGKLAKQAAYAMPSHPHARLATYLHYL